MGKEQTVASCFRRFPACAVGRAGAIGQAEADQPGTCCQYGTGAGKVASGNEAVPIKEGYIRLPQKNCQGIAHTTVQVSCSLN